MKSKMTLGILLLFISFSCTNDQNELTQEIIPQTKSDRIAYFAAHLLTSDEYQSTIHHISTASPHLKKREVPQFIQESLVKVEEIFEGNEIFKDNSQLNISAIMQDELLPTFLLAKEYIMKNPPKVGSMKHDQIITLPFSTYYSVLSGMVFETGHRPCELLEGQVYVPSIDWWVGQCCHKAYCEWANCRDLALENFALANTFTLVATAALAVGAAFFSPAVSAAVITLGINNLGWNILNSGGELIANLIQCSSAWNATVSTYETPIGTHLGCPCKCGNSYPWNFTNPLAWPC